jgi:uncharacterized membrane protein
MTLSIAALVLFAALLHASWNAVLKGGRDGFWGMIAAPMGSVSALRETSVLFAVLLGRIFFGEALTVRRIISVLVIAAGALCLE